MIDWNRVKIDTVEIADFSCFGTRKISENEVQISIWFKKAKQCKLCIYAEGKKKVLDMFSAQPQGMQDVFLLCLQGEKIASNLHGAQYEFLVDGQVVIDPYAREISGRERFGKKQGKIRAVFDFAEFDWQGESWKVLPTDEIIMYQCHVRGFTKHFSSKVSYPGTFSGIKEKISYLKDLGVNTLLFLPVYDFNEQMVNKRGEAQGKVNYWGYSSDAFYFAPKKSYARQDSEATRDFQEMIKEIHCQGMNVYLDMYFQDKTPEFIIQCLRYYVLRYHIDGFRINQECMDTAWLLTDPILSHVRLLGCSWHEENVQKGEEQRVEMNDRFLIDARRYLKSDEGQTEVFYHHFREQRTGVLLVHYITQHNGFTLRDLISYDIKHNEENGEKNLDGTEYNYSWNCGAEGPSRKKDVLRWRRRQEKNAFVMLLLGMATPMILAGDEFANSQNGNNNAYCQDNAITWLDWRLLEKNAETFDFVKQLIAFRKEHSLYHRENMLTGMDSKGVGAPDVSCHGKEPWEVRFPYYSRELGILFFGDYYDGQSLYFAFNFHWEPHEFYLPDVGEDKWRVLINTAENKPGDVVKKKYCLQPRSIVVLESVKNNKRDVIK